MPLKLPTGRSVFCLLVFLAVYPLVTCLSYLLIPFTADWPIWQRNLVMVPIIVLAMVFVIIPNIQKLLARVRK